MIGLSLSLSSRSAGGVLVAFLTSPTISAAGNTLTGVPGTTNVASSPAYSWYVDGIPIALSGASTLDYSLYQGRSIQYRHVASAGASSAAQLSTAYQVGRNGTLVKAETFSGTIGASWVTAPFTLLGAANAAKFTNTTGGYTTNAVDTQNFAFDAAGTAGVLISGVGLDVGSTDQAIEYDVVSFTDQNRLRLLLRVSGDDYSGWYVSIISDTTNNVSRFRLYFISNGQSKAIWQSATGQYQAASGFVVPCAFILPATVAGDRIRIEFSGGAFQVILRKAGESAFRYYGHVKTNVAEPNVATELGAPNPHVFNSASITAIQAAYPTGSHFTGTIAGLLTQATGATRVDALNFYSLTAPVTISSISEPLAGFSRNGRTLTTAGTYTGSPATLEYMVTDKADGTVLTNWATLVAPSGGAFSAGALAAAGVAYNAHVAAVAVRRAGDTDFAATSITLATYAAIPAFLKGVNEGFLPEWNTLWSHRDAAQRISWRDLSYNYVLQPGETVTGSNIAASSAGVGYDGIIHQYAGGITSYKACLPIYMPVGVYNITYPAGMTAAFVGGGGKGSITTALSGGTGQLTVTDGTAATFELNFSGTIPAGGLQVSIKKAGDPTPSRLDSDEAAAGYAALGSRIVRFMSAQRVNNNSLVRAGAAQLWTGSTAMGPVSTAFMISVANNTNQHLWVCIDHLMDDAAISAVFAQIAAGLNSNLKCYIEMSNEVWNTGFLQSDWFARTGCELGLYNTLGDAATSTIAVGNFTGSTGDLLQAYSTGDRIYGNLFGTGYQVWQANKANAIGSTDKVAATSNTAWTVVVTNAQSSVARKRRYAQRAKAMFALADAQFANPRSRLVRVTAWFAAGGYADVQPVLSWDNHYAVTDRVAIAPYWGGGYGGYDLGAYGSNYTGWGATEKALVATDVAAFKTAFFAIANTAIDAALATTAAYKQGLAAWLTATYGLSLDAIPLISYECNWHVVISGSWNAAINTQFGALIRDARMGTAMTRYATGLRDMIGGEHMFFDRGGSIPATGTLQSWALQENEDDITSSNYRFTALAAVS